jgi:hypothetical protein
MTTRSLALVPVIAALAIFGCGARSPLEIGAGGPAACATAPATPTVLLTLGPTLLQSPRATAITVAGSALYFSLNNGSNDPLAIERLATRGGTPTQILQGNTGCVSTPFGYGPLVTDGTFLYTPDEEMVTTCTGVASRVTRLDPSTGATVRLPNPNDGHQRGIAAIRVSLELGVLFLAPLTFEDPTPPPGDTVLARWDGVQTTTLGSVPGTAFDFVLAAGLAFVQTDHALYSMTLDGAGTLTMLRTTGQKFWLAGSTVAGGAIFYSPDGDGIVRRDVGSGTETVLATGAGGNFDGNGDLLFADDASVYFVQANQNALARVPIGGGPVEVLSPDEQRDGVNGVVTDACSVYWLAAPSFPLSLPPVIYARAR